MNNSQFSLWLCLDLSGAIPYLITSSHTSSLMITYWVLYYVSVLLIVLCESAAGSEALLVAHW